MSEPKTIYGFPIAKIAGFPYGEWTTEPPTAEGWYWTSDLEVVRVVREIYPNGIKELIVYTAEAGRGNEEPESVEYYCKFGLRWLGPLPEPEPPKG